MIMSSIKLMRLVGIWGALAILLIGAGACGGPVGPESEELPGQQDAPPTPAMGTMEVEQSLDERPTRSASDCPGLDSQLWQVLQAEDPLERAEELQLRVKGESVQVLLILEGEETEIPSGFDVEVGTRVGAEVQAYAPIAQLCELASTDEVLAIRPAAQATAQ